MSAAADLERLIDESAATRLRGPWLVSMLLGQGQTLRCVAHQLDRPGLEHMNHAVFEAARLHQSVAKQVPVIRRDKVVGSPDAKLFVGWALTLGLQRTNPDIDGVLATGLRSITVSRLLIRLVQSQEKFGADLHTAVDQAAALSSALARAESEIHQFSKAISGPLPE